MVHVLDDMRVHLQGLAEEFFDTMAGEQFPEGKTRGNRPDGKKADRNQHRQRRFMRGFIMLLIVRLTMEGLEDQAPRIKRGQRGRSHGCEKAKGRDGVM